MNEISASELKNKLDHIDPIVVIDVRETWEYEEQNIGARNIPLHEIPQNLETLKELKDTAFVVHCKSGTRSNQAYKYLKKNGFTKVINLTGGIEAYLAL